MTTEKDKINCENFDDGLTQVAPKGEFKTEKDIIEEDTISYWTSLIFSIDIIVIILGISYLAWVSF